MKLPSLLSRPKYKRFEYQPRYYDPIKEDIKRRTDLIKKQLNKKNTFSSDNYKSGIPGAFRHGTSPAGKAFNMQLLIVIFLICDVLLYFYTDNDYLWPAAILIQVIVIYFNARYSNKEFV